LEARHREQSGFTPHRSTVDRIITLNTLLQTCREFSKPLCIAYVDLKSAFDSVDRESLWLLLRRHGILDKLVELMKELYTDTCSCVLADGMRSEWFQVLSGVRQGCTVVADLFLNPMDWILNRTVEQTSLGVSIGEESFSDLDYTRTMLPSLRKCWGLWWQDCCYYRMKLQLQCCTPRPSGELDKNKDPARRGTTSDPVDVQVSAQNVDLVDEFIYLASLSHTMEEVRPKFCDASGSQGSAFLSLRRTSGGLIYSQTLRCTSTGPTSFQSCSMGARN